jgi:conjugal transfer pilus assembly protein TraU
MRFFLARFLPFGCAMTILLGFTSALADSLLPCVGKMINPATDICWDCLLPITVGSATIKSGQLPDTANPSRTLCKCPPNSIIADYGFTLGYWEPMALVDVTRTPFCMVSLGGVTAGTLPNSGDMTVADTRENNSFFHVHAYRFPIMRLLNFASSNCSEGGFFMPQYLSELDPTWEDDTLSMTLFPETAAFGDPISQAACGVDATAASVGLPVDESFWCAGAQGTMYPVTGNVAEHIGGVQASVLLAERLLFRLHRLGLVQDSSTSPAGLCSDLYLPIMPKSRYRYQMTYPVATTQSAGCQPFGRSTIPWEAVYSATQESPTSTESYAYLIWRKRNCCDV